MTRSAPTALCPEQEMTALLEESRGDAAAGLRAIGSLLPRYPNDARLHFLKGSYLAARQDYGAARDAMRVAVDLAPDYAIARFQLGFLELTSGRPYAAQEAWGPLHGLGDGHYLRKFADGLCRLIRDDFSGAVLALEDGIAANRENLPLNGDMRLIVEEIGRMKNGEDIQSPVGLLLRQSALKTGGH